jgi:hypothetical protein
MTGTVEIVLIAAAIIYVLGRRLMGEPAVGKRLLLIPAALGVFGVTQVAVHSVTGVVFLVVSTALSVAFGLLRGMCVRTYEQNGVVMLRYTVMTIVLWAASIAARLGAGVVLGLLDPSAVREGNSGLMLAVGAGLLAEGVVVMTKAVRVRGQVVWSRA